VFTHVGRATGAAAISPQELATKLIAWRHPGFSAHVAEPISADDTQTLENLAGYAVRNPLSLQRLVYLDGQQAVIYKGLKHNPTLGRNFEIAPRRRRGRASLKRSQPRSAAVARVGRA
jgi:hypothetical protein